MTVHEGIDVGRMAHVEAANVRAEFFLPHGAPVIASLNPTRVVLRVAWGPALALLMAAICALTGATVVGTWWWLR